MSPKYLREIVSQPTKADEGSNLGEPLYDSLFDFSALCFGDKVLAQQLVQKFAAQMEFVPDDCFVVHDFSSIISYIKCAIFNLVRKLN